MSTLTIILITVYLATVLGFGIIMEVGRRKFEADFIILQLLVPFIWPMWVLWYLGSLAVDALRRKK